MNTAGRGVLRWKQRFPREFETFQKFDGRWLVQPAALPGSYLSALRRDF